MTSTIPDDIQAMLDVYTDGTPAVPMICQCSGKIELDDYETERYICVVCHRTYNDNRKHDDDDGFE